MLKQSYQKEDQIPENLKGAYVADTSGVFVLDELGAEHPTLKKNAELVAENTRYRGLNTKLQNEKTQLESRSVPEGFVAVKVEDAPIIEKIKTTGLTVEELTNLKTENEDFKRKESESALQTLRRSAGKFLGYNEDAFERLAKDLDLTEKDGKFFTKDGANETPLTKEFVEKSETFKPFLSSLAPQAYKPGNLPDPRPDGAGGGVFDRIRDAVKTGGSKPPVDIDVRFGRANA